MVRNREGHDFQNYFKQVKQDVNIKKLHNLFHVIANQIRIIFLNFSGVVKKFILLHPLFSKRELEN